MSMTRHAAPRRAPALAVGLIAAALVACAPAPGAAGASPAPAASTAAAASPAASPSATPSFTPVGDGPNMVAYSGEQKGYLAVPAGLAAGAKAPALVIVHEWWGLNDHIKSEADRLAKEGYVTLAADLFGGRYATTQDGARALTGGLNQGAATANLVDAIAFLRARQDVNGKVGALGWCFGGGQTMQLLLNRKGTNDLAAGVIYYGNLETDAEKLKGLPPVLGNFGRLDQNPAPATAEAFDKALDAAGVTNEVYLYDDANHAFANPSGGERYNAEAAATAWTRTLAFLAKHLK